MNERQEREYVLEREIEELKQERDEAKALLEKLCEVVESHREERKCAIRGAESMMNASYAVPCVESWFKDIAQNCRDCRTFLKGAK